MHLQYQLNKYLLYRHWIGLYDAMHGDHIERDWRWTSGEAVIIPRLGFDDSQPDEYKQPNGYGNKHFLLVMIKKLRKIL